jgi:hypothetical protein
MKKDDTQDTPHTDSDQSLSKLLEEAVPPWKGGPKIDFDHPETWPEWFRRLEKMYGDPGPLDYKSPYTPKKE